MGRGGAAMGLAEHAGSSGVGGAGLGEVYNLLAMDGPTFRVYARLMHRRAEALTEDAMIAATAIVHGLAVVTRNVRDFRHFGVRTFDPFTTGA